LPALGGVTMLVVVGLASLQAVSIMVKAGIKAQAMTYGIGQQKIEEVYELFSKKQVEFAMDRITGVVIQRGPIDRILGTVTLVFRSIGSGVPITFDHVKEKDDLVERLLKRLLLVEAGPQKSVPASFGLGQMLRAQAPLLVFLALVILVLFVLAIIVHVVIIAGVAAIFLLVAVIFVHRMLLYRRQVLELFPSFMRIRQGILNREEIYFPYVHVKSLHSRRYIGTTTGILYVQAANHGGQAAYLEDVDALHEELDAVIYQHPGRAVAQAGEFQRESLLTSAPLPKNTLLRHGLISIVLFPLLLLLAIRYVAIKRVSYGVEAHRLVQKAGIFYRTKTTVLFNRIDHVKRSKGAVDKMSGTGAIQVYTVGSPTADLVLADLRDDGAVFEAIDSHLPSRG
ncbi:MAG: PH domain-containing protein, partial [Bradymonadaceae bacterium]